ncbi:unnamed protein product [Anisakis simplex]|uniref:Sex-determining region Y protein n=1 Tax=Anisakis simplex TaxID=6269 RepID=A0A158PP54_ANISI|nr:unnamed protein product [Anisakis simplex]
MSVDESRASTPSVDISDYSSSPAPSSSQTPITHINSSISNGYHNGITDFSTVAEGARTSTSSRSIASHMHFNDNRFIKRPLNAYMIWTKQERKKILESDPSLKMHEVSRMMGEKWKVMTEKEKKPFFELSKQSKLEHKRVLRDNPNLIYHPQRRKFLKSLIKAAELSAMEMDVTTNNNHASSAVSIMSSQSSSPSAAFQTTIVRPRISAFLHGCSSQSYQQGVTQAQVVAAPSPGTVLVAQALGVRTPVHVQTPQQLQGTPISFTFQTAQPQSAVLQKNVLYSSSMNSTPTHSNFNSNAQHATPANMHQMLDLYYTSLCQPAFPEPGETSTMAPPQYYLDQYQQLHYQAIAAANQQNYAHQAQMTTSHSAY